MARQNDSESETTSQNTVAEPITRSEPTSLVLRELIGQLRQRRAQLREDWVSRITESRLLTVLRQKKRFSSRQLWSTTVTQKFWRREPSGSYRLKSTTPPSASFPRASKRTKLSASRSSCAMSSRVLYSPGSSLTLRNSTESWTYKNALTRCVEIHSSPGRGISISINMPLGS